MTRIWLSPRLPADREALAAAFELVPAGGLLPPAGTDVAVAAHFEHDLLDDLADRPPGLALVVIAPPGIPVTDVVARARAQVFATAISVDEIAEAIRSVTSPCAPQVGAPWRAAPAGPSHRAGRAAPPSGGAPWRRRMRVLAVAAMAAFTVALGTAAAFASGSEPGLPASNAVTLGTGPDGTQASDDVGDLADRGGAGVLCRARPDPTSGRA
jgi:hypothetical protein